MSLLRPYKPYIKKYVYMVKLRSGRVLSYISTTDHTNDKWARASILVDLWNQYPDMDKNQIVIHSWIMVGTRSSLVVKCHCEQEQGKRIIDQSNLVTNFDHWPQNFSYNLVRAAAEYGRQLATMFDITPKKRKLRSR